MPLVSLNVCFFENRTFFDERSLIYAKFIMSNRGVFRTLSNFCDETILAKTVNGWKLLKFIKVLILLVQIRNSPPKVFLRKGVLKLCSKFTGEHPCRSVISIEITFLRGCSHVNLPHIFRTPFPKKITRGVLLTQMCNTIW